MLEMNRSLREREIVCWTTAFILHALLFLWQGSAIKIFDIESDPILSVDFIVEEVKQLGVAPGPKSAEAPGGILGRIKKMLGFSQKVLEETKPSEGLMTGDLSQKINKEPLKDFEKRPQLQDKVRGNTPQTFAVSNMASKTDDLKTSDVSTINAGPSTEAKLTQKDTKLVNKDYRVSRSDLPFEIAKAPQGELATGGSHDPDAPVVAVGDKTDRGVFKVSKELAEDRGSYGGSGGTGGSGLSGAGDFSSAAPVTPTGRGSTVGGGGLAGTDAGSGGGTTTIPGTGDGRSYSGGSSRGFGGIGETSGGAAGGSSGEGTGLAEGSGGTGKGKGTSGGGDKVLFELTGPLSNRPILRQVIPPYPEWAQKKGIIAQVSLYFFVLHTGDVKNNIVIHRTSGYPALDKTAIDSLIKWKFAPLSSSQYGKEQWGIITFKFKVK